MDRWDLLKWRKTLRLTQTEAGEGLGVHRATIVNWERGATPIPKVIEFACLELTRRRKQRAEYGPVVLIYCERAGPRAPDPMGTVHYRRYANNNTAIEAACRLMDAEGEAHAIAILGADCEVIWNADEIALKCEGRGKKATRRSSSN
jgi:hypothetical protein